MRIWDIPCEYLCDKHLLGEHRELHCIWTFITTNKGGSYKKHPETLRWFGKERALADRHSEQIREMAKRGFKHKSDLLFDSNSAYSQAVQNEQWQTLKKQIKILKAKNCDCKLDKLIKKL